MPPDLAAVIVTYNSAHVVGNLLDSLPGALDGLSADVIVVDNASTDNTVDVLMARGDCRIVRSANVGYAGGINLGVRQSPGAPAILVLNPDVVLHPQSVRPLVAALNQPGVGIVAPQVRSEDGRLELSLRREPTILRALGLTKTRLPAFSEYVAEPAAYLSPRPVDWATGAVLAMSRDCFDALGGWDESYFLYSEEVDASLRAREAGLVTWYEPQAVATHIGGQSGRSDTTHAMQIINRVRLYRRRHGSFASWCYYAVTVANELSRIPRGHAESRASVLALLKPTRRPSCLRCSDTLVPR
ncbi:MAG TPA: glycosyltransferase family 2 protein [Streptosporangiaceae bacterium]|nr:glycosyltransferase family 2 protein [Streptosporangiaceae bacterium]